MGIMSMSAFDVEDDSPTNDSVKLPAFFTLKKNDFNDEDVHKWAIKARDLSFKLAKTRTQNIEDNFDLYKGISHHAIGMAKSSPRGDALLPITRKKNKDTVLVINHMNSLVANRVSRMKRYSHKPTILPANSNEETDRTKAQNVQDITKYIEYANNFDLLTDRIHLNTNVAGEAFMFVEWDPEKYAPSKSKNNLAIGDVCFRVPQTKDVWFEPNFNSSFEDARWLLERKYEDIDELREDYGNKNEALKKITGSTNEGDDDNADARDEESSEKKHNTIPVYYLWVKGDKYLKNGRFVKFTTSGVLENKDHIYTHKRFPCVRITGIDVEGEMYPMPVFDLGKHINNAINNLYSIGYTNQARNGKPKWLIHEGSHVSNEELSNDQTRVNWRGQHKPELAQWNNTPTEIFQLIQDLTERLQQNMGVFGVSRGEPPAGIRAGIALQFLNEQENELFNADVKKFRAFIKQLWLLAIDVMAQFYDASDERVLQIFGENNEYMVEEFNPEVFTTPFDIRVQDTGDLPDSKAAKTQYLLDLDERKPMEPEQFFEYLGMATPEAYLDETTRAKRTADRENSKFLKGEEVESPESWEDQIIHWKRHMLCMNDPAFKAKSPIEQEPLKMHVAAHEELMLNKAFFNENIQQVKNPAMVEFLSATPNFPSVYEPQPLIEEAPLPTTEPEMPPPIGGVPEMPMGPGAVPPDMPIDPMAPEMEIPPEALIEEELPPPEDI